MQNRLFVANKPKNRVSNHFLGQIKRKYGVKSAGFSGILDPFASGVLIIAFGQYTKLFRFLKKSPKTYKATLWLGASSDTLDIDGDVKVKNIFPFHIDAVKIVFDNLVGKIEYLPPKYSAKKIDGKRAYEKARNNEEFEMKKSVMEVYELNMVSYSFPFLTFTATVSEGAYIRSLGEIIAKKLGTSGILSSLKRLNEGKFVYENEKALNPLKYLDMEENFYLGDEMDVKLGKKLSADMLKIKKNGVYTVKFDEEFAIIKIEGSVVKYELNKVKLC